MAAAPPMHASAQDPAGRAAWPAPPALHWAALWIVTIATLGVFGVIWTFVQAAWVRRIDSHSNARGLLGLATGCLVAGGACVIAGVTVQDDSGLGYAALTLTSGKMLLLGWLMLHVAAYFSMATSLRRQAAVSGPSLEIGGGSLFLFSVFYLQGQLRWLARWKATGQTSPAPPQGIFWVILLVLGFAGAVVATIGLTQYTQHRARTQIAEGIALADGAKSAMVDYYGKHHALPLDNGAAGLARSSSISGKYVSAVNVAGGAVTVTFDTVNADQRIRHQALVLFPLIEHDKIRWDCHKYSTVADKDVPDSCGK